MLRSTERILTTHAGSLPRPARLTELYARRSVGEAIDEAELAREAEAAVQGIVPKQKAAGIDVGNNGEQPREAFFMYLRRRLSGFGGQGTRPKWRDVTNYPDFQELRNRFYAGRHTVSNMDPPKVVGEIRYLDKAAVEAECVQFAAALKQHGSFVENFVTAPSPGIVCSAIPNEHYDSMARYIDAVAQALAIEYRAIIAHGFLLQIDAPDLALERHVLFADRPLGDFIGFMEQVIDAINRALDGIPREKVRLHVCWGNYEGPHDCDVALNDIMAPILAAKAGALMMPLANPRHAHEHRCFKGELADDQLLIAGVIDTTTNYIEHPEVVADRLELAARAIGDPTRVLAGTDCGFDTSAGMGRVAESVVWAKLSAMRDGARIASQRLIGRS
jgi:5-methyltetrahydropteroyltriglutamate--homocysteine methyltransferase